MSGVLAKIMAYEKLLPSNGGSGLPFAGKFGFAADADYSGGWAYTGVQTIATQIGLPTANMFAEEVGLLDDDNAPDAGDPGLAPSPAPGTVRPTAYGLADPSNIGSMWLTNPVGGAAAYIGENEVLPDQPGVDFLAGFYKEGAAGYVRLGDMWRLRQQSYFLDEYPNGAGYDPHFAPPRYYLGTMVLFGDPSMRVQ